MRIRILAASAVVLLGIAATGSTLLAHESETRHLHMNGGVPPFYNVQLTWYQDIVYDDGSADTALTSLDVYVPEPMPAMAPVLVYAHGGGFGSGDKADLEELGSKPGYFTHEMGYIFVSVNYRLMPEVRYPDNSQDVANALAWLHDNVADYGGDPEAIVLMGWDVGGVMAAQLATDPDFLENAGKDLSLLKGVIPVDAGGYDLRPRGAQGLTGMFGPDPEVWAKASPVTLVSADKAIPPFFMIFVGGGTGIGGINTEEQSELMAAPLRDSGFRAELVPLWDRTHNDITQAVGEPGEAATMAVQDFLERVNGARQD